MTVTIELFKAKQLELTALEKEVIAKASSLSSEFYQCINDSTIPLQQRWALFTDASDQLKQHFDSIYDGKSEGMKYYMDQAFRDSGRGKHIDMIDRFNDYSFEHGGEMYPFYQLKDPARAQHYFEQCIQEMLERRLSSFVFNW